MTGSQFQNVHRKKVIGIKRITLGSSSTHCSCWLERRGEETQINPTNKVSWNSWRLLYSTQMNFTAQLFRCQTLRFEEKVAFSSSHIWFHWFTEKPSIVVILPKTKSFPLFGYFFNLILPFHSNLWIYFRFFYPFASIPLPKQRFLKLVYLFWLVWFFSLSLLSLATMSSKFDQLDQFKWISV